MPNSAESSVKTSNTMSLPEWVGRFGPNEIIDAQMDLTGIITEQFPKMMFLDDATQQRIEMWRAKLATWQYFVWNGPGKSKEEYEKGVNCQFMVHYFLKEFFNITLDESLLSLEMFDLDYEKNEMDDVPLSPEMQLKPGDVVMFDNELLRKKTETGEIKDVYGPKYYHMALVVGADITGQPVLMHMLSFKDKRKKSVALWTLKDFALSKYHYTITAVRRPKGSINHNLDDSSI